MAGGAAVLGMVVREDLPEGVTRALTTVRGNPRGARVGTNGPDARLEMVGNGHSRWILKEKLRGLSRELNVVAEGKGTSTDDYKVLHRAPFLGSH